MNKNIEIKKIIISRTDSIGDVVLTLPVAGILKEKFPKAEILFLGKTYTQPVIAFCKNVDSFLNWDDISKLTGNEKVNYLKSLDADAVIHVFPNKEVARLAKQSKIPVRIGTSHRTFHWLTCNYTPNFTRKNSNLHESQLNFKLLSPLGIESVPAMEEVNQYLSFKNTFSLPEKWKSILSLNKKKIILHPKSKGSAREWNLENYSKLIGLLPKEKYQVFISGTAEEKKQMEGFLDKHRNDITDLTGQLSLNEFIAFINECDVMVAASTGPLHIAGALNKKAIGIYPPMRPIHPGRWKPLGKNAIALCVEKNCTDCRKSGKCSCINEITADEVYRNLL